MGTAAAERHRFSSQQEVEEGSFYSFRIGGYVVPLGREKLEDANCRNWLWVKNTYNIANMTEAFIFECLEGYI